MYKIIGGDQREYGPVDFNSVLDWIRQGRANAQTLVQKEGGPWVPLGSLAEFAEALGAQAAATPVPAGGGPATPPPAAPSLPGDDRRVALQAVQGPAIALLIYGILHALTALYGIVNTLIFRGQMMTADQRAQLEELPPEMREMIESIVEIFSNPAMAIGSSMISLLMAFLIILGAVRMRSLLAYPLAITATILAMLPCNCPCCCLGLPLGIWALVVLLKPDVRMAFR